MDPDQTWKPFSWLPTQGHMHYWRDLLTLAILALAFPYMLRLTIRNPGAAAVISNAV